MSKRLFIALPVPDEISSSIYRWQKEVAPEGASAIAKENYHLTLAFLGMQNEKMEQQIIKSLGSIKARGWQQSLKQTGQFKKPQIGYLTPSHTKPELSALASQVQSKLDGLGIAPTHGRFIPHVTLFRKLKQEWQPDVPGWSWPVTSFSLYHSDQGRYLKLKTWVLKGD